MRWSRSHFVEDNGGWLYETNPGLQDDVKTRENLSGTLDWTYAANSQTIVNAHVGGTNALESLEENREREVQAEQRGASGLSRSAVWRQLCAADHGFQRLYLPQQRPAPDWWRQFDEPSTSRVSRGRTR